MYIYCIQCHNNSHISEWKKAGGTLFCCPNCGHIHNVNIDMSKMFNRMEE